MFSCAERVYRFFVSLHIKVGWLLLVYQHHSVVSVANDSITSLYAQTLRGGTALGMIIIVLINPMCTGMHRNDWNVIREFV